MNLQVKKLTKTSIILLLGSILLTSVGFNNIFQSGATSAPISIILSQTVWNGVKVLFYLLLVLRLITNKDTLVKVFICIAIIMLPFSQYLLSPGGLILSVFMFVIFLRELRNPSQVINIEIQEGKKNSRFSIQKFELLGFVCCLLCSLYNAKASTSCPPYWETLFTWLNSLLEWPKEASSFVAGLYSMGLNVAVPSSLSHANYHGVGLLNFSLIWSVLPFLYVLYFGALYIESKKAPYEKVQKLLCIFCIFHFLFLTNLVGYRFSRGWDNYYSEWFHWGEKFAWRVAILLPIYQYALSNFWKKGSKLAPIYYFIIAFALIFLVYQVLFYDVISFVSFVRGENLELYQRIKFYYFYHPALLFMTLYYLCRLVSNSKSHLCVVRKVE